MNKSSFRILVDALIKKLQVSDLNEQYQYLTSEIQKLEEYKKELVREKEDLWKELYALGEEKATLQSDLNHLKATGIYEVNREIDSTRRTLIDEVKELKSEIEELMRKIKTLKKSLATYLSMVSQLSKGKEETKEDAIWVPITDKHPIFDSYPATIDNYINSLKQEYMDRTGATREICDREFQKYCPNLNEFIYLFKNLNLYYSYDNNNTLYYMYNNWVFEPDGWGHFRPKEGEIENKVRMLMTIARSFKFPIYQSKVLNTDKLDLEALNYDELLQILNRYNDILKKHLSQDTEQPKTEKSKTYHL